MAPSFFKEHTQIDIPSLDWEKKARIIELADNRTSRRITDDWPGYETNVHVSVFLALLTRKITVISENTLWKNANTLRNLAL